MRYEETSALDSLIATFGGKYKGGEDPPDAYITLNGQRIAVEVTMLVEQITRNGKTRSRFADEVPVWDIASELEQKIGDSIPDNSWLYLGLPSPINEISKFKKELARISLEFIKSGVERTDKNILGNRVSLYFYRTEKSPKRKVAQFVSSRQSFYIDQAELILRDRIEVKNKKIARLAFDEYWLALINTYWPASIEIYRKIYDRLEIEHKFDKIFIIDQAGKVESLC